MGGKKKRSRSRDRSEERSNSKRLRKLEDLMGGMLTSIASIQQAIQARVVPASDGIIDQESVENLVDKGTGDIPVDRSTDETNVDPRPKEPEVSTVLKDVTNGQSSANSGTETTVDTSDGSEAQNKEAETEAAWVLEEDALRIIGEEPISEDPQLVLHSSVAKRWKKYLTEGLSKEVKESLLKKYPRAGELSFEAPLLNDEVVGNLKEGAQKRDKYFSWTQQLAGSALSALAPVVESLAPSKDPEHMDMLEKVWDAAKLLIEIHRSQTVARKACILPTLSKQWATALEKRVTDKYLFGDKLADKVKEIKAMGKVGEEMKTPVPKKPVAPASSLNWRSSLSQKSVSQSSWKPANFRKPPTPRIQPRPAYQRPAQFRQQNQNQVQNQNPRSQNR